MVLISVSSGGGCRKCYGGGLQISLAPGGHRAARVINAGGAIPPLLGI